MKRPQDGGSTGMSADAEAPATHQEVPAAVPAGEDPATCPLGLAINTIGGRWKLHVLRTLLLGGPRRYNDLLRSIDGISAKELTRNLRELQSARLIAVTGSAGTRTYALTMLGTELEVPFRALGVFGAALALGSRGRSELPQISPSDDGG